MAKTATGKAFPFTGMKTHLVEYVESVTTAAGRAGQYVCPLCGSGTGPKGTAAFYVFEKDGGLSWQSHCCGQGGDLLDLIGAVEGLATKGEQMRRATELFGEDYAARLPQQRKAAQAKPTEPQEDFTPFFLQANKHLDETDYYRGISRATLDAFKVGYVAAWKAPNVPASVPTSPRLIIPTGPHSYLARDTRPGAAGDFIKQKVGRQEGFFNEAALQQDGPCFVVEGELDALSVIDCGFHAVALGTTGRALPFARKLKDNPPKAKLILALDADNPGQEATGLIVKELSKASVPFSVARAFRGRGNKAANDANEALNISREQFQEDLQTAIKAAGAVEEYQQRLAREDYGALSAAAFMDAFRADIRESVGRPILKTGFHYLDGKLDGGGLKAGVYVIGAVPNLGKTAFALQIADSIAEAGHSVLFFSLEMSRFDLMARSISRHTAFLSEAAGKGTSLAKTGGQIADGRAWLKFSQEEREIAERAMQAYSAYAGNIFIVEADGENGQGYGIAQIEAAVKKHSEIMGEMPAIFVDYLQIIASPDPRYSDKQRIDETMLALKRMARRYGAAVVVITSFNRQNYGTEVNLGSAKESGAVEYGCDCFIGLQYCEDSEGKAKRADGGGWKIEAKMLKQRKGDKNLAFFYDFDGRFSLFRETGMQEFNPIVRERKNNSGRK